MVIVAPGEQIQSAHTNAKLDADNSNIKPTANFVPDSSASYDLGITGTRWKNLFLSGDSKVVGNSYFNTGFLTSLASDPAGPTEGQFWYNTTDKKIKYYNIWIFWTIR